MAGKSVVASSLLGNQSQSTSDGAVGALAAASGDAAAGKGQSRARTSRWDIPPQRTSGDSHSDFNKTFRPRTGSSTWKRHRASSHKRCSGVGDMVLTASVEDSRLPLGNGNKGEASNDQRPLSTPSPTYSAGTVSSDLHDDSNLGGIAAQIPIQNQDVSSSICHGSILDLPQVQEGETMDVDRAAAQGPNAPLAP